MFPSKIQATFFVNLVLWVFHNILKNMIFLHLLPCFSQPINLLNRFIKQPKPKKQDKKVKYLISSVLFPFMPHSFTLTLSLFQLYCSAPLCYPLANSFIRTPLLTALISDPFIPWLATSKERERRGERERAKREYTVFHPLRWMWFFTVLV